MTTGVKLGNAATSYITNSSACTFHNPLISIETQREKGEKLTFLAPVYCQTPGKKVFLKNLEQQNANKKGRNCSRL